MEMLDHRLNLPFTSGEKRLSQHVKVDDLLWVRVRGASIIDGEQIMTDHHQVLFPRYCPAPDAEPRFLLGACAASSWYSSESHTAFWRPNAGFEDFAKIMQTLPDDTALGL
ncbi:hypothetical protein [Pseudomonas parafulva]|uniref:hypothetical protein n=1 Tax=Pseudomonas parafulva TaxID=157782 RepID=UPI0007341C04|nr:hypothetical protein [Pseudomonas parafulva]KTT01909.1 hypothetical protein NS212_03440 [Pseudomonas parafulva]